MFASVPWADAMYAVDVPWWKVYGERVVAEFKGSRYSQHNRMGATKIRIDHFSNSGAALVSLAAHFGCRRVVMLAYDCQKTGGKVHSHGDHPKGLGNAGAMPKWPGIFAKLARRMKVIGVTVINASRETALTCFPRMPLEQALAQTSTE